MSAFSIIVPVYNEQELIPELAMRISQAIKKIGDDYEVIFVNDGSTDKTLSLLLDARKSNPRLKVLNLSRNFGHQAAYTAGLNYSKGDCTVMMDGDLQDPPELIPDMYAKMQASGSDIVYGKRSGRRESLAIRTLTWLFHKIFDRINKNTQGDTGNFCLLNRRALDAFLQLNEKNRYLPGLRFFIGFQQECVEYQRPERSAGKAKMSFWKLMKLAFDAIFSFSKIPIRIALIIGIIGILISTAGIGVVVYKKIIGDAITGWTSTMLSIYFLGSVQLFFLGILGEYVFRIYKETQNRPVYVVKEYFS